MDGLEIAYRRLHNQHLLSPLADPVKVVRHFGAMQAQEFAIAKWSVGQRSTACDREMTPAVRPTLGRDGWQ
jgi:hypothetical protein